VFSIFVALSETVAFRALGRFPMPPPSPSKGRVVILFVSGIGAASCKQHNFQSKLVSLR
jgi:hypothetical protein